MSSGAIIGVFSILIVSFAVPSWAINYIVGDSAGWTLNTDYTTWTTGKTFAVGDTLVFNYGGGHKVNEVNAADYSSCTVGNSLSTDNSGMTSITLTTPGTHYFICAVLGHCNGGMKLAVTTAGGDSNATTTPLASPPPSNVNTTITPTAPAPAFDNSSPPFNNTNTTSFPPTYTEPSSSTMLSPSIAMMLLGTTLLVKLAASVSLFSFSF